MYNGLIYMFKHPGSRRIMPAIALVFILSMAVVGCGKYDVNANSNASESYESPAEEYVEDNDGGNVMSREFVEVALVAEDHIMLENTKGIFYWVDIKYNENYSEGDLLCLVFRDKEKLQEDCYRVEPIELYPNDNRVNIPSV